MSEDEQATAWTKELPKESGFYWYRYDAWAEPEPVGWDAEMQFMECLGDDRIDYDDTLTGEFWPVPMLPPSNLEQRAGVPALPSET